MPALAPATILVPTPHGPAAAHLHVAERPRGALVLGHGAGGGIHAGDLVAVTAAAQSAGFTVVLVEQPYRVAGRRAPPRAPTLDVGWSAVLAHLAGDVLAGLPLVVGGRSSGARVACRTAVATGAIGVLCLAFPLQPPARSGRPPAPSRLPELDAARVPVLVIQGDRDPFGLPPAAADRTVAIVSGDHSLRVGLTAVAATAREWLAEVVPE
ncbi:alpha/beta hydrolase family protein [Pengzhenrongella sicca]|uniref:Alpha/beta hydrolase n=1 Tax=Pengzhenrongella sicca TaxID=2819238 RepID=A0A8A4ZDL3_9MICO|nr:alpha/beta family hydrolase [Pengzhenrongella sicca]QTE27798.1 alpha/beta hydrolase [Pengzhenrongella sicca]